ncbi:MAG: hypothetical protein M0D53_08355 [Flavobacterium sp. JAD_PAG50586_2]|nr:MAG: hypothetical protein M0D53_08355 [Flavobacterium sp. JAD_PAG50586_2]
MYTDYIFLIIFCQNPKEMPTKTLIQKIGFKITNLEKQIAEIPTLKEVILKKYL